MHQGKGLQCNVVFTILNSLIQTLQYADSRAKLAVGFDCGRVAMLDMSSLSVLFITDFVSSSCSPVISVTWKVFTDIHRLVNIPTDVMFILTRYSHIVVVDTVTGNVIGSQPMHQKKESTAINMYIIEGIISISEESVEKHPEQLTHNTLSGVKPQVEEATTSGEGSLESLVLLCCEDALHLFSLQSLLQEDNNSIPKVNLVKPCCWTTTFNSKDTKCGLVLLYQTGVIEVRLLPVVVFHWNHLTRVSPNACMYPLVYGFSWVVLLRLVMIFQIFTFN